MTEENPYAAVVAVSAPLPSKRGWLLRFLVLNVLLVGLPIMLALAVWVMLAANGVQISGSSGSVGLVPPLIASGYVAIPNLIMFTLRRMEKRRGEDAEQTNT